jgi:hypothetical protein
MVSEPEILSSNPGNCGIKKYPRASNPCTRHMKKKSTSLDVRGSVKINI